MKTSNEVYMQTNAHKVLTTPTFPPTALLMPAVRYPISGGRVENNTASRPSYSNPYGSASESKRSQPLLAALLKMIIPLIQAAVSDPKDLHQVALDLEAEEFLVALRALISSIVEDRPRTGGQNSVTRTTELNEKRPLVNPMNKERSSLVVARNFVYGRPQRNFEDSKESKLIVYGSPPYSTGNPSMFASAELFERAMTSLRTHIFDELPIRLLYFQRKDSRLDITVLDRAGVYSHLSSKLRRLFNNEPLLAPRIVDWKTVSGWVSHLTSYAILSHVWLRTTPGEVTYNGWHQDSLDLSHPGYNKITTFCSVAEADHGVSLGWMDTVCIDKSSSAELDESIRSMYKWYQNAEVCITYLSTTTTLEDMNKDAWFTRGWTLQELFAPKRTKFYDAHWKILVKGLDNDKEDSRIQKIIQSATSITPSELTSTLRVPISRKMQWAAKRCVSRGEDSAYSLMGIFHVTNMSIAYGEGAQLAFIRLLKEILGTTKTHVADLFNWGGEYTTTTSAVLPSNPLAYLMRSSAVTDMIRRVQTTEPIILTHLGLRIPVLLLPATVGPPTPFESIGDYYANTTIQPSSRHQIPHSYHILDAQTRGKLAAWVFVVLNCGSDDNNVHISKECFAVLFRDPTHSVFTYVITSTGLKEKISTKEPIVFQLNSKTASLPQRHYTIQKTQLGRHGMQFSSMYL